MLRKKVSRSQLLAFTANLPWSLIGMEACSGAHFFAAKLRDQGHEVGLNPDQFVKPFVKTNKERFLDTSSDNPAFPGYPHQCAYSCTKGQTCRA
jgi:transposase